MEISLMSGGSRGAHGVRFWHSCSCKFSVQCLAWQPLGEASCRIYKSGQVDPGVEAHRLQHEDEVFGRDVTARSRRVGTAAEPAKRRVKRANTHVQCGYDVG